MSDTASRCVCVCCGAPLAMSDAVLSAEIRETLLAALRRYPGWDLARAKAVRLGLSPEQLLDTYEEHAKRVGESIEWVEGVGC